MNILPKLMHTHKIDKGKMVYSYSIISSSIIIFLTYIGGDGGLVTKSCPTLVTPWTVACQAPLSMGFSRQEYWSGLSFPSPEDLPDPGIELRSPASQAESLPTELPGKPPHI